MQVQSINYNQNYPSFGSTIKFENPQMKNKMIHIADETKSLNLLNRFYHLNQDTVTFKLIDRGYQNAILVARNERTGVANAATTMRITPDEYDALFKSDSARGGCDTFYNLLERLLDGGNQAIKQGFWGNVWNVDPKTPLENHPAFKS